MLTTPICSILEAIPPHYKPEADGFVVINKTEPAITDSPAQELQKPNIGL